MSRKLGKIIRNIFGSFFFFHNLEKLALIYTRKKMIPPIFIVGAPRSGTTLVYEYLLNNYKFGYLPNIVGIFYKYPLIAFFFIKNSILKKKRNFAYQSDFGFSKGVLSPSEVGWIFEFWFGNSTSHKKDEKKNQYIKDIVYSFSYFYNAPLILKNAQNSLRLDKILDVFPEATVIHVMRDPFYNSQSILNAREKITGSVYNWWPRKPYNYEKIKSFAPAEQVVIYIQTVTKFVEKQKKKFTKANFITIPYEEFCSNPIDTLNIFYQAFSKYKVEYTDDKIRNKNFIHPHHNNYQKIKNALSKKYEESLFNEDII